VRNPEVEKNQTTSRQSFRETKAQPEKENQLRESERRSKLVLMRLVGNEPTWHHQIEKPEIKEEI
jgi:hypothetical protein